MSWRRPDLGPDGQRRPEFQMRPVKPIRRAFRIPPGGTDATGSPNGSPGPAPVEGGGSG